MVTQQIQDGLAVTDMQVEVVGDWTDFQAQAIWAYLLRAATTADAAHPPPEVAKAA